MLNHDITDAKDRCGINVPSLISSKTDYRIEVLLPIFTSGK